MAYESTVQVIQRGGKNRQWYLICPAPLAQALEIEKGEVIEWVVEDRHTLVLKRTPAACGGIFRGGGARMSEASEKGQQAMWAERELPTRPPEPRKSAPRARPPRVSSR